MAEMVHELAASTQRPTVIVHVHSLVQHGIPMKRNSIGCVHDVYVTAVL